MWGSHVTLQSIYFASKSSKDARGVTTIKKEGLDMSTKPPEMSYWLGCFRVCGEHKPVRIPHQHTHQSPCPGEGLIFELFRPPCCMSGGWANCRIQAGLSKNVRLAFQESKCTRNQEPAHHKGESLHTATVSCLALVWNTHECESSRCSPLAQWITSSL